MKSIGFMISFIALLLVSSVLAETVDELKGDVPKHTNTFGGMFGGSGGGAGGGTGGSGSGTGGGTGAGAGGAGGYSAGFSHGGIYGGGKICKWGCCSKSFGYSHKGGGYYGCTCCATAAQAKVYKQAQNKN